MNDLRLLLSITPFIQTLRFSIYVSFVINSDYNKKLTTVTEEMLAKFERLEYINFGENGNFLI